MGSEEAVERPYFWPKRSHAYQARKVQEPEKQKKNSEKGGGAMVEVGRKGEVASTPKPIVGSKHSCPAEKIQLRKWEGRDVVVG